MSQTTHRITRRPVAAAEPDLVDRIFDYIFRDPALSEAVRRITEEPTKLHSIKAAIRSEFGGREVYVATRPASTRDEMARRVLELFNGRNASEVARELQIGRATVYRILKQAGTKNPSVKG